MRRLTVRTPCLDSLYRKSAGNLARATRLLDSKSYAESRSAFLACRALDAFEDMAGSALTARVGIEETAAFLLGNSDKPPVLQASIPECLSDRLEMEVVGRLPDVRDAIANLDRRAKRRVHRLIAAVAAAMTAALRGGVRSRVQTYGALVLGRVCEFAFRALDLDSDGCPDFRSMGILLQAANDLRDMRRKAGDQSARATHDPVDNELQLNLTVVEMAPQCVTSLSQIRFRRFSRARGAIALFLISTACFFVKRSRMRTPPLFRYPRLVAYFAVISQRCYERALLETERVFDRCVSQQCFTIAGNTSSHHSYHSHCVRYSRLQSSFEARIASWHPDHEQSRILVHATELVHTALRLSAGLPPTPLAEVDPRDEISIILMVSDYLIACAIAKLSQLGSAVLHEAGSTISALARSAQEHTTGGDYRGELTRFLTTVVAKALGHSAEQISQSALANQAKAVRLYQFDHNEYTRLGLRRAHLSRFQARPNIPSRIFN